MSFSPLRLLPFFFLILLPLSGCSPQGSSEPEPASLSQSSQKFLEICRTEYDLNPAIRVLPNTIYVYLPIEDPILEIAASGSPSEASPQGIEKFAIRFLEAATQNDSMVVTYDVGKSKTYPKSEGYGLNYPEGFQAKQRNLYTAFYRSHLDLMADHLPGDVEYLDSQKQQTHEGTVRFRPKGVPDFIVFIAADIKTGIEVEAILNFLDFKRYMTQTLPQEEFTLRNVSRVFGDEAIIEDDAGEHVEYKDITWPEFLARQIEGRIRFQYGQSSFPPSDDPQKEITEAIKNTLKAYDSHPFDAVILKNLDDGTSEILERSKILK